MAIGFPGLAPFLQDIDLTILVVTDRPHRTEWSGKTTLLRTLVGASPIQINPHRIKCKSRYMARNSNSKIEPFCNGNIQANATLNDTRCADFFAPISIQRTIPYAVHA